MEALEIFKKYKPIKSIYETENELICFPKTDRTEPLAVFYDKSLGQYTELYYFQDSNNAIPDAVEYGKLIYGEELKF